MDDDDEEIIEKPLKSIAVSCDKVKTQSTIKQEISSKQEAPKVETRSTRTLIEVSQSYKPEMKGQRIMTKVNIMEQPHRKRMKVAIV
jgi:hypothetical protein